MKRCPELQKLSREHHPALTLSVHLKRDATSGDEARIALACWKVRQLFENDLKPHFDEEEDCLLPLLAAAGAEALVARTLAEHVEIVHLVQALETPDGTTLARFAEAITAHVRFEERELFEAAQQLLDQEALTRIAQRSANGPAAASS
jgi:hemerythrin-like domain-containing protein